MKPITLDSVVSDPRYLPEVDALALHRAQTISTGGRQRGDTEYSGEKHAADLHSDFSYWSTIEHGHVVDHHKTSPP